MIGETCGFIMLGRDTCGQPANPCPVCHKAYCPQCYPAHKKQHESDVKRLDTADTWCSGNDLGKKCGACPGCAREAFRALEEISKQDGPGLDGSPGGPYYVIAQRLLTQKT